jgi:hypothetical protein
LPLVDGFKRSTHGRNECPGRIAPSGLRDRDTGTPAFSAKQTGACALPARLVPRFVPSDYGATCPAASLLRAAPGRLFCEWGSGFGVVACLAALLDFDACGIEIDEELVEAARQLAQAFDLPQFVRGAHPGRGEVCVGRDEFVG